MNIAIVAVDYPFPPDTGMRIDNYHLALNLAREHTVHLITFDGYCRDTTGDDPLIAANVGYTSVAKGYQPWKHLTTWPLRLACALTGKSYFFTWYRRYRTQVWDVLEREGIDRVFAHKTLTGMFVDTEEIPAVGAIMEVHQSLLYFAKKKSNPLIRMWRMREARLLIDAELEMCRRYETSFVCMQEELSWIEEQIGENRVRFIPYGVDTAYYTPDPACEEEWLIGSNGNQEAMGGWPTASSIFPLIRKHNPQARLLLLGGNSVYPPLMELAKKDPAIELPGYLSDDEFLRQLRRPSIYVFPVEFATGTKNSALMALALGKPVVATRAAMSGVDLNQAAVILAETPQEFAEAVDALLKDKERRVAMGAKNRDYAVRELDWSSYAEAVLRLLE